MGPLISERAVDDDDGGSRGGPAAGRRGRLRRANGSTGPGFFVEPALVKADRSMAIVGEETFAPILYVDEATGRSTRRSRSRTRSSRA